jgi:hypothetical protein
MTLWKSTALALWAVAGISISACTPIGSPRIPADFAVWDAIVTYEDRVYHIVCWSENISITTTAEAGEKRTILAAPWINQWNGIIELWIEWDMSLLKELNSTPVIVDAIKGCNNKWTDAGFDLTLPNQSLTS